MNNPSEQSLYQSFTGSSQHSLPGTEAQNTCPRLQGFRNPISAALPMPAVPAQNGAGVGKNSCAETVSLNLPQRKYQLYTRRISSQAQHSSQQKLSIRCNPQGQNGSWTFSAGDSESSASVGKAGAIFQLKRWQFLLL